MELGPGTHLDTYELLSLVGRGGMGEVWLARDLRLDRKVAVKVLPARLTHDADRVARFRQEARAASALNHPNVCTVHTLGDADQGRQFIAMEYIEGSTLRERLAAGPLPIRDAAEIAAQMAAGLAAAHAAGVIHRDVKPENVMIRSDGLVKILDFGLAKLDPGLAAVEVAASTRTALPSSDSVGGTIAYMSPEQAAGHPLDARTDIFSLGAVLYEMVTGRAPFAGNAPALVLDAILNRTPVPPMRLNPDVLPRLEDVIMKALEKDRDLRYQTASELRTDLLRLKRDSDSSAVVRTTSDEAVRLTATRRTWRSVPVVAALLLTAAAVAALVRWRTLLPLGSPRELQEIQLTTNSSENPVNAAAISPDGKYLAYGDLTGIHLRAIDSGETNNIAAPDIGEITRLGWFPDGSRLLVSGVTAGERSHPAVWSISLIGGAPRKLRDDGLDAAIAPDGLQIAFIDPERKHVWVMGPNGEEPRALVTGGGEDTLYYCSYWAGKLGYGRVHTVTDSSGLPTTQVFAELRDPQGHTIDLFSDPGLRTGILLPDGRWLYSVVAQPILNAAPSLWESKADLRTGGVSSRRRLRDWPGRMSLWDFSATADGKRVAFLKRNLQMDVFVADSGPDGTPANPRRLTLDDSDDFVTNWTSDGRNVFFTSDRNGSRDIFKQALDSRVAEAVVSGPEDESGPTAISPDGTWLYYLVTPKATLAAGNLVMRTPSSGGAREKIGERPGDQIVLCARPPSTVCVFVERDSGGLSIYSLNPQGGKGRKITGTVAEALGSDISPDGSRVAVLMPAARRLRILPLSGEPPRDVALTGWPVDPTNLFWSGDGNGWYVSSTSAQDQRTDLLHVDLSGRIRAVWHQNVRASIWGIPSPDGRHIAITQTSTISNVWMLKGF